MFILDWDGTCGGVKMFFPERVCVMLLGVSYGVAGYVCLKIIQFLCTYVAFLSITPFLCDTPFKETQLPSIWTGTPYNIIQYFFIMV